MPTGQSTLFNQALYFDEKNPFKAGGYIGQCTWYCWSKAHSKALAYPDRNLNVSNIPTGNAGDWLSTAKANGYTTSTTTPKADSIAVFSGHVLYVETWDGTNVCFSEANWNNSQNADNTIQVPDVIKATVQSNVAALTKTVTVKGGGTDGEFKTLTKAGLQGRAGFLGYIYLN